MIRVSLLCCLRSSQNCDTDVRLVYRDIVRLCASSALLPRTVSRKSRLPTHPSQTAPSCPLTIRRLSLYLLLLSLYLLLLSLYLRCLSRYLRCLSLFLRCLSLYLCCLATTSPLNMPCFLCDASMLRTALLQHTRRSHVASAPFCLPFLAFCLPDPAFLLQAIEGIVVT